MTQESREVSRTECRCDRRHDAMVGGAFLYWPPHRAWIFPDLIRRMSAGARYFALVDRAEFPHEDHTGECYRWVSCPWCGHSLPNVEAPRISRRQADGGEGDE